MNQVTTDIGIWGHHLYLCYQAHQADVGPTREMLIGMAFIPSNQFHRTTIEMHQTHYRPTVHSRQVASKHKEPSISRELFISHKGLL